MSKLFKSDRLGPGHVKKRWRGSYELVRLLFMPDKLIMCLDTMAGQCTWPGVTKFQREVLVQNILTRFIAHLREGLSTPSLQIVFAYILL